jgi:hypothetical protein
MALTLIPEPFPTRISFGAHSEAEWATELVEALGGDVLTNENRERAKHNFDVSLAVRKRDDYITVRSHHHMARGRARAFLFLDSLDYTAEGAEGVVADSGDSPSTWQMFRRISMTARSRGHGKARSRSSARAPAIRRTSPAARRSTTAALLRRCQAAPSR